MNNWSNNPEVTRQKHSIAAKQHMDIVLVNLAKGRGKGGSNNSNKTECYRGHEYNDENSYVNACGSRVCRICRRANERKRHAKHQAIN